MHCKDSSILVGLVALIVLHGSNVSAGNKLDDATILAIFDQANTVDILNGRLGAKYGHSEAVRQLGQMVATEHVEVQQMGRDLAKKLNILPTPPAQDASVADHAKTIALLQSKTGPEFDKVYLQHELTFHQSVITAIKETLLPAAQHSELKQLMENLLPGFEHHLAETRAVAKKIGVE